MSWWASAPRRSFNDTRGKPSSSESQDRGNIYKPHQREVKLPESVLSSRRPHLTTGHWNNLQRSWWNAGNAAACLSSRETGKRLKRRFKAWVTYVKLPVISSDGVISDGFTAWVKAAPIPRDPGTNMQSGKKKWIHWPETLSEAYFSRSARSCPPFLYKGAKSRKLRG